MVWLFLLLCMILVYKIVYAVLVKTLDARQEVVCKITDFGESRVIATTGAGRDNLANPGIHIFIIFIMTNRI